MDEEIPKEGVKEGLISISKILEAKNEQVFSVPKAEALSELKRVTSTCIFCRVFPMERSMCKMQLIIQDLLLQNELSNYYVKARKYSK